MKQTAIIMGMPITVEIIDRCSHQDLRDVFNYFRQVDRRFSPYKSSSELSKINRGLDKDSCSEDMRAVLELCEQTKNLTGGYFDINHGGRIDTSGLVKGWSINNAADILKQKGFANFYIEAGGDIQAEGLNADGRPWQVGIRNPFNIEEIVKVVAVSGCGVATSGCYIRGQHIYDPHQEDTKPSGIASLTVIGPDIFEADRFATAAFAMGSGGIGFINALPGFAGYMINDEAVATYTPSFESYAV